MVRHFSATTHRWNILYFAIKFHRELALQHKKTDEPSSENVASPQRLLASSLG
jgi:hypothetical protein